MSASVHSPLIADCESFFAFVTLPTLSFSILANTSAGSIVHFRIEERRTLARRRFSRRGHRRHWPRVRPQRSSGYWPVLVDAFAFQVVFDSQSLETIGVELGREREESRHAAHINQPRSFLLLSPFTVSRRMLIFRGL